VNRIYAIAPPRKAATLTLAALVLLPVPILGAVVLAEGAAVLQPPWLHAALIAGLAIFLGLVLWGLRRMQVQLQDGVLTVRACLYRKCIALDQLDLDAARIIDLDRSSPWWPVWRTNGIGLPGLWVGHHRGRPWRRRIFCAVTTPGRTLLLPLRGQDEALLLSMDAPQALLDQLRRG